MENIFRKKPYADFLDEKQLNKSHMLQKIIYFFCHKLYAYPKDNDDLNAHDDLTLTLTLTMT